MKNKIGIILISNGWAGAERVVRELLNASKENYVLFVNNEIYSHYTDLGIKVYNLGNVFDKNLFPRLFILKKIAKMIDEIIIKEKINLVNPVLEYSFLASFFMKSKIKFVPALHGAETMTLLKKISFAKNYITKNLFNKSSKIISVSQGIKNLLPQKYKQKTIVIQNGVDSITFKPLKNIKQEKKVILFTGRFIERKGCLEVLKVAKQLTQYEFWFAGKGELENEVKGKNVKNLGFQSTGDLVKLYNKATLAVFPAHWEALPLCGLEAMSCGKAVIATPLGFSEYIDDKKEGIIISAKDESALKKAIVDLMKNPKKRKMLEKKARKKALKYSWDKVAKKYLKVFEGVSKE